MLPIQAFELAYIFLLRWVHWNSKQLKFRKLYQLEPEALNLLSTYERDLSKVATDLANDTGFLKRLEIRFSHQSHNDPDEGGSPDTIGIESATNEDTAPGQYIDASEVTGYSDADSIVDEALYVDKQLAVCSFLSEANPNSRPYFSALRTELQSSVKSLVANLDPEDGVWVAECMNNYKHAKMDYSFLGFTQDMSFILNESDPSDLLDDQRYPKNTESYGLISNQVKPLLGELSELTQGIGITDLIEDLASGHVPSPLLKDFLNIIPGTGQLLKCAPVLLALSSGANRSPHNINSILNQVVGHLIECGPRRQSRALRAHTQVVVVIFEKWDERNTVHALKHLARFRRHGVEFVFLHSQTAAGKHALTEKAIDLTTI